MKFTVIIHSSLLELKPGRETEGVLAKKFNDKRRT